MPAPKSSPPPPSTSAPAPPGRPRRILLLIALLLLVAGFSIALYAVVHRPAYVVLVHMDELEEGWFRQHVAEFAEHHRVRLTTRSYADADELERLLRAGALERKNRVLLAQVPQDLLTALVEEDLVQPFDGVRERPRLRALNAAMAPEVMAKGGARDRTYYMPATIRTPLLFYSKERLADAVAHWTEDRARIDAALARENGRGLPENYRLEEDPIQWDTYDVAVVASYWAAREHEGLTVPRVAHAAIGDAAALDLATRAYGHGAGNEELLQLDGVALRDALAWESVFLREGWYHTSMIRENWRARDLLTAAAQGQLFLGWLDSADLFRLHGTGAQGLEGFFRNPADLGVARVPRGASLDLERGWPARVGNPYAGVSGTWWSIPRTSPDAGLAFDLVEHLSQGEFQTAWAQTFGGLPTRRDLLREIDIVFQPDWQFAIARMAKKQVLENGKPLPVSSRWRKSEAALLAGWRTACAERHLTRPIDLATVLRDALATGGTPVATRTVSDSGATAP